MVAGLVLARLLNGKVGILPAMTLAPGRIGWSNASFRARQQVIYELARAHCTQGWGARAHPRVGGGPFVQHHSRLPVELPRLRGRAVSVDGGSCAGRVRASASSSSPPQILRDLREPNGGAEQDVEEEQPVGLIEPAELPEEPAGVHLDLLCDLTKRAGLPPLPCPAREAGNECVPVASAQRRSEATDGYTGTPSNRVTAYGLVPGRRQAPPASASPPYGRAPALRPAHTPRRSARAPRGTPDPQSLPTARSPCAW